MPLITTPPSPLDDPSVEDPLSCPPLRWGILGCGRVAHDFCLAMKHLPTQVLAGCAARSLSSAETFAKTHNVEKAYGSYDELIADENVQIIYVANLHVFRRTTGEKCLNAGKHILMEKPFACSAADASYLAGLAKEKNLFAMEGMWTRFFPAVEQARRAVFGSETEKGIMGDVVAVQSDFSFNASDSEEYPTSFFYNHDLGGGASFLVGPYPTAAALMFFKSPPSEIKCVGQMDPACGVDLQSMCVLNFPPTGEVAPASDPSNTEENTPKLPGAGTATLFWGLLGESVEETVAIGTKGRLTIHSPGHCPTKLTIVIKGEGRGGAGAIYEYDFELPKDEEREKAAGGYVYPNSSGFAYEAAAVARLIAAGKTEAPQCTLRDTISCMKVIDESMKQLGVKPVPNK